MTLLADPAHARPVTAAEVTDAVLDGAWIVDVREDAPPPQEPTAQVGWLVPWEDDIVLLAGSPDVMSPRPELAWR